MTTTPTPGRRVTKIVATIGPASESPAVLAAMIDAGMDVARIGLAHGSPDDHVDRVRRIRAVAEERRHPVGVLADLPGPKIRAGTFPDGGGSVLLGGHIVDLVLGDGPSTERQITIDGVDSFLGLEPGDRVAVGDGALLLEVEAVSAEQVSAVVRSGGRVQGSPGVHLPADRLSVSAPTPEDLVLLERMLQVGVDHVAVSFVCDASDIRQVREAVGTRGPQIMAKIETPAAVEHLDELIEVSDAVMVARGDLGVELPLEDVPHLQKRIIRTCVEVGRPVITATQMLESMINAATPTRAEASDVANAVFDGTDALMLSGETAIGTDPARVVATMSRLAQRAEREADYAGWGRRLGRLRREDQATTSTATAITSAITRAAWGAALSVNAAAVICCTRSGATARAMARFRPIAPLYALSPHVSTVRQLALSWGVIPVHVPEIRTTDDLVWLAVEKVFELGAVQKGDVVVVLAGSPTDPEPVTDVLRVVRVR